MGMSGLETAIGFGMATTPRTSAPAASSPRRYAARGRVTMRPEPSLPGLHAPSLTQAVFTRAQRDAEGEIVQEDADRAWGALREKEASPKEVQRWRAIQLDDYETDIARYVLLALHRCHRERNRPRAAIDGSPVHANGTHPPRGDEPGVEPESWATFASLQANELAQLRACPGILEHQTRIYRLLRGRFGASASASKPAKGALARSPPAAETPPHGTRAAANGDPRPRDRAESEGLRALGALVTVDNVRTVLAVDPGNSFGIWETPLMEESECLGFAVYPVASLFNHRECSQRLVA